MPQREILLKGKRVVTAANPSTSVGREDRQGRDVQSELSRTGLGFFHMSTECAYDKLVAISKLVQFFVVSFQNVFIKPFVVLNREGCSVNLPQLQRIEISKVERKPIRYP